jgi:hypothetical protein
LLSIGTFHRNLIVQGKRNVYVADGNNPIKDTSSDSTNLTPVGLFSQGGVSSLGMANSGNDMVFISHDGLRSIQLGNDASSVLGSNLAEVIKSEVSEVISNLIDSPDELQATYYPKRDWVLAKLGSVIYNFNFTPYISGGSRSRNVSISKFTGKIAQMKAFFVREDGTLVCCGDGGEVFSFDQDSYSDDGDNIPTSYKTSWLSLQEPQKDVTMKKGSFIKPFVESKADIVYTIAAEGDFTGISSDSISFTVSGANTIPNAIVGTAVIGGSSTKDPKLPLKWRGEQFTLEVTTNDTIGPDKVAQIMVYGTVIGRE